MRALLMVTASLVLGCVGRDALPTLPPPAPGVVSRILGLRAPKATTWELVAIDVSEPGFALLVPGDPEQAVAVFDYGTPLSAIGLGIDGHRVSTTDAESPLVPPLNAQALSGGAWQAADFAALDVRVNYRCPQLTTVDQRLGNYGDGLGAVIPVGSRQALAAVHFRDGPGGTALSTRFFVLDPERAPEPWPPSDFPASAGQHIDPATSFSVQMLVDPVTSHPNILVNGAVVIELDEALRWVRTSTLPAVGQLNCAQYPSTIAGGTDRGALELYTLAHFDFELEGLPFQALNDVCRVRIGDRQWTPIGWQAAGADNGAGCMLGVDLATMNWKGPGRLELAARRPVAWTYDASQTPAFRSETVMPVNIGSAQNLEYCRVAWLPQSSFGPFAAMVSRLESRRFLTRRTSSGWKPESERVGAKVIVEWDSAIVADAGPGVLRLGYYGEGLSAARTYTCEPERLGIDAVAHLLVRGKWLLAAGNPDTSDALYVTWLKRSEQP